MSQWARFFDDASWSGSSWGLGNYSDGEQAPPDQVVDQLRLLLLADTVLAEIFGERIEAMEYRPPVDLRLLPRIYLYSGTISPEHQPTQLDANSVPIVIGVMFQEFANAPKDYGKATFNGVLWRIFRVVVENQEITMTVNGSQVQVSHNTVVSPWDTLDLRGGETERHLAFTKEMQVVYNIETDRDTGRIIGILLAS